MEKLHILLVCPDGTHFRLIKQTGVMALALSGAGYRVSVLVGGTAESPLKDLKGGGNVVHVAPFEPPFRWLFKGFLKVVQAQHFKRRMRQFIGKDTTIDIVHLMDCRFPFSFLAQVPEKFQMPVVANVQRPEDLTGHGLYFWQRRQHEKNLKIVAPLVVSSSSLLEAAHRTGLANVVYIPHGVRVDQFKPVLSKRPVRRALGLPEKPLLICCMADITPQNAQLELLERCYPLSQERQLLLIGQQKNTSYLERIQKRAAEKGVLDYLHVLDANHQPENYLKACDVFMLLGGVEARHTTILEAQSAGLPVVLGPSESSLMLCNGNRSGVVLYPNNPLAKQAFEKLLTDPTYRQGRAMNARPFVRKEFSFKGMMAAYNRLYHSL